MPTATLVITGILVLGLLGAGGLLSSRNLAEYMVSHGILPRSLLQLTPVFVRATRWLAVILIVVGLGRAAAVAGLLSSVWVERYGLASLLVGAGIVLLLMTFRRRPRL
ncbi:MAG TPA: hypothetical protein VFE01_11265 [Terracidiphilus sp.]|nr:hypothetical protein [Terracidiphilus sp.]